MNNLLMYKFTLNKRTNYFELAINLNHSIKISRGFIPMSNRTGVYSKRYIFTRTTLQI